MNLCAHVMHSVAAPLQFRSISTTCCLYELIKMSRVKVVDNSMLGRRTVLSGKRPRIIQVYNKPGIGHIGDKVLLAIMGEKKKAYIVGCAQTQKANIPRFDTNNARPLLQREYVYQYHRVFVDKRETLPRYCQLPLNMFDLMST